MNTKWVWVGPLVFLVCLAVVEPARADFFNYVTISGDCLGGNNTLTTVGPGPVGGSLSNTASCTTGTQSVTESELATFSTIGTKLSTTGLSPGSATVSALSVQLLTVTGVPSGETVDLKFDMQVTGSYMLSPASGGLTGFFENTYIFLGGMGGGTGCSAPAPTSVCLGASGAHASGTVSGDFMSGTFAVQAGTQYQFEQEISLSAQASAGSSVTADFLDPASIVNVVVTDPTTGAPISGVSVTTANGISFPVNGAGTAAPEPSSLYLFGAGVLGLVLLQRRKGLV